MGHRTRSSFRYSLLFMLLTSALSLSTGLARTGHPNSGDTLTLCFVSDTQEPMWFERVYLSYNHNADARHQIFDKICGLNPRAVIHLGDLVSMGSRDASWEDVDRFTARLQDLGIDFSPIPGNHEYLLTSAWGIPNFTQRYPFARLTGYSRRYGDVAVVLVNSNFDELTKEEREEQLSWYRTTLEGFQKNTAVNFIIVGCHHPPFTNSTIVSASQEVCEQYLPEFFQTPKCRLFVSGHAHAYEHFRMQGKDFLVLGGGGGLQHPLRVGTEARYDDLFSKTEKKRMFHFLVMQSYHDSLFVNLEMLQTDFRHFDRIPQLAISRPAIASSDGNSPK